jgi:hypothetical protein
MDGPTGPWGHEAQTAHVEEFLAGTTSGQAAEPPCLKQALRAQREGCELTGDSAGLTGRRRGGGAVSLRRSGR